MRFVRQMAAYCAVLGLLVGGAPAALAAAEASAPEGSKKKEAPKDLVLKGDAKCTACHDEADSPELLAIGKTRHGTRADKRTPECSSCHGESQKHADHKGSAKPPKPDRTFGKNSVTPTVERNDACMTCHQQDPKRSHWAGSTHQARDVNCASCHQIHRGQDKVRNKLTQAEVCFTCHKEQRAQVNKPSHHPIMEGKVACSDCHNPHGSAGPKLMVKDSVVDTCHTCHMEKRGPFVYSHQPVTEDCSICHNPHGTTAESLLKARPPFLCNTCHTGHAPIQPAVATGPTAAVHWSNGPVITQGRACLNCHTQVHGSNNPSGASPTPQRLFR